MIEIKQYILEKLHIDKNIMTPGEKNVELSWEEWMEYVNKRGAIGWYTQGEFWITLIYRYKTGSGNINHAARRCRLKLFYKDRVPAYFMSLDEELSVIDPYWKLKGNTIDISKMDIDKVGDEIHFLFTKNNADAILDKLKELD